MITKFSITPIRQGQKRAKPFPVDHTADPMERIFARGCDISIFQVEKEVPERACVKRSIIG
ncbi:hypothetical protein [Methanosphaerula palustris]|uniref:hypothetical protein n=1 Tax=Methanosphaerula palustris TaxID=475088 RepID=UPI00064F399F|nr:hypothetical protein [Methanosphaerula palustris]